MHQLRSQIGSQYASEVTSSDSLTTVLKTNESITPQNHRKIFVFISAVWYIYKIYIQLALFQFFKVTHKHIKPNTYIDLIFLNVSKLFTGARL